MAKLNLFDCCLTGTAIDCFIYKQIVIYQNVRLIILFDC
ncbi:hypothetical protein CRENPOLYSF1_290025 [Crenothrix polyspora]|uniref:Uncharacterized protein n=1 Tax=Crenothrix polyspora TaxID=360316 RepID=A0A1R4H8I7_9GAMM|nr:hypothetical protein CRENPOLYSF1_290025 [Crenothrix polyspora]